jgi:hypothetical protein
MMMFLMSPSATPLAVFAATGRDGEPLSTPSWYRYDDAHDVLMLWPNTTLEWMHGLADSQRVSVVVVEMVPPFSALCVQGIAELLHLHSESDGDITAEMWLIGRRYLADEDLEPFMTNHMVNGFVVRVRPMKVEAWRPPAAAEAGPWRAGVLFRGSHTVD